MPAEQQQLFDKKLPDLVTVVDRKLTELVEKTEKPVLPGSLYPENLSINC